MSTRLRTDRAPDTSTSRPLERESAPWNAAVAVPNGLLVQYVVPAVLVLLGCAALAIDLPVARWFEAGKLPTFLKKTFDLAEVFGHGAGVAAILLCLWVLMPAQRSRLPRLLCCAYLGGLAADGIKLLVARNRPYRIDLNAIHSVWQSFQGWFPIFSGGSAGQSFISAHTATAVGLALGLGWLLPRGRWLFLGFAVLVALQRMAGPYHFCSDTLWGAGLGWFVAALFLPGGWVAPAFDRLEHRLARA